MPAKHAPGTRPSGQAPNDAVPASGHPHAPVIERRIGRLQDEVEAVARSRPWGPALGFTAAWLGLMAVFIGLVTLNEVVTVAGVMAMLALIPALLATSARRRQEARLRAEIDEQERRLEAEEPDRSPVDRLLQAHLDHVDRHFRLVAEHADRGFLVAVGVAGLGFLLVVVGLVLGVRGGDAGRDVAWVAAAAGLGMQVVATVLFFAYGRSLGHLRSFQERLDRGQDRLLAFHHAAALAEGEDRDRVLAGLITAILAADGGAGSPDDRQDMGRDALALLRRASS
jgi:membrane protein implicated in regulation of membrane protease activity